MVEWRSDAARPRHSLSAPGSRALTTRARDPGAYRGAHANPHPTSNSVHERRRPIPHPCVAPPGSADQDNVRLRKRPIPQCLIIRTTTSTETGRTRPPAAAPTPRGSSPPTVNAAASGPSVSTPPNRSARTAPCSPNAAPTPSPPPRLTASGVACPKTSAPARPDVPASRPGPGNASRHRTLEPRRTRTRHEVEQSRPPTTTHRVSSNPASPQERRSNRGRPAGRTRSHPSCTSRTFVIPTQSDESPAPVAFCSTPYFVSVRPGRGARTSHPH